MDKKTDNLQGILHKDKLPKKPVENVSESEEKTTAISFFGGKEIKGQDDQNKRKVVSDERVYENNVEGYDELLEYIARSDEDNRTVLNSRTINRQSKRDLQELKNEWKEEAEKSQVKNETVLSDKTEIIKTDKKNIPDSNNSTNKDKNSILDSNDKVDDISSYMEIMKAPFGMTVQEIDDQLEVPENKMRTHIGNKNFKEIVGKEPKEGKETNWRDAIKQQSEEKSNSPKTPFL